MKIAIAQINTTVGDLEGNTAKVIEQLRKAHEKDCDLAVFHELTIPGYPPRDLILQGGFIMENLKCVKKISRVAGELKIAALVGFIHSDNGREKYNAVAAIDKDGAYDIVKKFHLPNYNVFDEKRYFTQSNELQAVTLCGVKLGIHICEDMWDEQYEVKVVDELVSRGAQLLINLSASPFEYGKRYERFSLIQEKCSRLGIGLIYVNAIGGQDELIFDGESVVSNPNEFILVCKKFEEDFKVVTFDEKTGFLESIKPVLPQPYAEIAEIHDGLVLGIRDYMEKNGFTGALIGLSGGIDSAVVAALAVRAIGAENVMGILMPSHYSSDHSISDAEQLAYNLKMRHHVVPIGGILDAYVGDISPVLFKSHLKEEEGGVHNFRTDVTEQNFQARIRGNILMGFSNDLKGYIVLSTGNKSESAVGYCTLYGDMSGGLSVIGDTLKTKVYALAKYINSSGIIIPINTIRKHPSAELKPDQVDQNELPPYEVLDGILSLYIEEAMWPEYIISKGYSEEIVRKVVWMVKKNEYKRRQGAPALIISPRDLNYGRRFPITNRFKN